MSSACLPGGEKGRGSLLGPSNSASLESHLWHWHTRGLTAWGHSGLQGGLVGLGLVVRKGEQLLSGQPWLSAPPPSGSPTSKHTRLSTPRTFPGSCPGGRLARAPCRLAAPGPSWSAASWPLPPSLRCSCVNLGASLLPPEKSQLLQPQGWAAESRTLPAWGTFCHVSKVTKSRLNT